VSGLFVVVVVRAQRVVDTFRDPFYSLDELRFEVERLLASIEKARAGGAPRGANGRPS